MSILRGIIGAAAAAVVFSMAGAAAAEPSELPLPFAYNYGETDTPRSNGMAGAGRALGNGVTALYLNPASMGLSRVYHIEALGQFTPEAARQLYGGAIVDSTRRLSGGLSVIGGFQDPDGINRSQLDVKAALAFAVSDAFHAGIAGRYLSLEQEGLGPLGSSRASGGLLDPEDPPDGRQSLVNGITFDAGVTIRPVEELHFGVVGTGLSYPNHGLMPTTFGGGAGYGTRDFAIEVDAVADLTTWQDASLRLMAGGEVLLGNSFPLRAGYRLDMLGAGADGPSHQVSAGFGYLDPRFAAAASVRRTVAGPSATTITVGLAFYMESLGIPTSRN